MESELTELRTEDILVQLIKGGNYYAKAVRI